eukprot:1134777-Lingulodinium_polyedra.AAC.1
MVKRAAGGAVVKAPRAAHFLDWVPGKQGFQPFPELWADRWPATSHRIPVAWAEGKEALVAQEGEAGG